MKALQAHYDGKRILLDGDWKLKPNTKLLVLVADDEDNDFMRQWHQLSSKNLARAYDVNEPDYPLSMVKEPNAGYERK